MAEPKTTNRQTGNLRQDERGTSVVYARVPSDVKRRFKFKLLEQDLTEADAVRWFLRAVNAGDIHLPKAS